MTQLLYAGVVVLGLVIYGLGRALLAQLRRGGVDAARSEQAEAEAQTTRRQAEILLENRSPDDAARDLDRGDF